MTDLLNRHGFYLQLPSAFSFARSLSQRLAIITLDLDNLKQVNDTYEHNCGDALIVDFAKILSCIFHQDNLIARFGGDEFDKLLNQADQKVYKNKKVKKRASY